MSDDFRPRELSFEELKELKARKRHRQMRRRERDKAGEIKELNITAMMDMMTILLVFLCASYSSSALSISQSDSLTLPQSTTRQKPKENIQITISQGEVSVNEKRACAVVGGLIPADAKAGADSFLIPSVYEILKEEVDKQKYIAQFNKDAPFQGRVNVVADRRIPYRTLMEVLYTAGQAELGEYKFLVQSND